MRWLGQALMWGMVVTAVPVTALARGPGKMQELKDKVGVDDATAGKVREIFDRNREARHAAQIRQRNAREKVESLVRANSTDEGAYRSALDELQSAREAMLELRKQQVSQLKQVLSASQQARLLVALEQRKGHRRGGRDRDRGDR
ncbi:MAG: periplasmic heavy metal sensor [Deltaproteobacteria bacterium]|nr:periplasmic heavy metal sensor [Deltaproteobacteria bacterium]